MISARRRSIPLLVLLIGLVGTLAAALALARAEFGRQEARFQGLASSAVAAIEARMLAQLTILRGAAGFFNASGEITAEEFGEFVERLHLDRNYPGVLGIGYAAYAPDRAALARIVERQRQSGRSTFRAWPDGQRDLYSTIVYLQPMNRLNAAALGFDMLSEPTRRAAMLKSARAGASRMSGQVRLVQEIDPVKQPGFLIYLPIYTHGGGADATGRGTLRGWVYSPLRAHDLFGAIFAEHRLDGIVVEIYDGAIGPEHLLYRSAEPLDDPARSLTRNVNIAGRKLLVRISAADGFREVSPYQLPAIVVVAGALISLLAAFLLMQQLRAAAETEQQVADRTAELRAANAQLLAEAAAREAAESQVRQMQKMEAIGQLTGGIAHDFNNMLAVIVGNVDLAERRLDQPERVRRALANAKLGAEKAAELTGRLLAFGRKQTLQPQPIEVGALIDDMSELLRRTLGEDIRLETRSSCEPTPVCADRSQLESAILNVAINARDAMPRGGTLAIETSTRSVDGAVAEREAELTAGDYVLIAISDTGTGMPADVAARAMEPFFTTKAVGKGSGLGLSQVYGFARQSGGYLTLQTAEGAGTTITLYLPLYEGPLDDRPSRARLDGTDEASAAPKGSEAVLVVEDDDRVREVTCETLAELGYRVISAPGAEDALAALKRDQAIRLLFTDVVMPDVNGRELADRARSMRPGLKVLFTSGYSKDAIVHDGRLDTGVSLLRKPFSATELARRIRQELDS